MCCIRWMHSARQLNAPRGPVTAMAIGLLVQDSSHVSDDQGTKKFAIGREFSPSERVGLSVIDRVLAGQEAEQTC